jgi:hypothetical protein
MQLGVERRGQQAPDDDRIGAEVDQHSAPDEATNEG